MFVYICAETYMYVCMCVYNYGGHTSAWTGWDQGILVADKTGQTTGLARLSHSLTGRTPECQRPDRYDGG